MGCIHSIGMMWGLWQGGRLPHIVDSGQLCDGSSDVAAGCSQTRRAFCEGEEARYDKRVTRRNSYEHSRSGIVSVMLWLAALFRRRGSAAFSIGTIAGR
jgi:hypothetical protein